MKEEWRNVNGYEGFYVVNKDGYIKSMHRTGRILSNAVTPHGYLLVCLHKNAKQKTFFVHRIVAEAFIPNLDNKPFINHKNGIKTDNRIENLEWCTSGENIRHAFNVLRRAGSFGMSGKTGKKSKLSKKIKQIDINTGKTVAVFFGTGEASRHTGIFQGNISRAATNAKKSAGGYKWEYI